MNNKIIDTSDIVSLIIDENGYFPGNTRFPFLIYKNAFNLNNFKTADVETFLKNHAWYKPWVNGIFKYHHYHSNNHETLIVFEGTCDVEIGGEKGKVFTVKKGDCIVIPAGVSHKNIKASTNFQCVGGYGFDVDYDMNFGKESELAVAKENIKKVGMPAGDIFNGILFTYWKYKNV